ncbi:MAG: FliH/SctL family protein [Candidatus Didemnitutus sp.]|jgi:flagellar assembly protein FliH|nr:FliH/SctL family protein [Candidatus Didemnitutus sp.]
MAYLKLIAFDRALAGAVLPGRGSRFSEAEVAAKVQEGYRQGVDAARAVADHQMVELRHDMEQLSHGVLEKLSGLDAALTTQLRDALPGLAIEIARRLLAGYEPPAAVVEQLCRESLEQLFPEREGLEISLCARDAELLQSLNPDWLLRYPDLRIRTDAALAPGDCLVRSRFGLTDARQQTKLAALAQGLTGT